MPISIRRGRCSPRSVPPAAERADVAVADPLLAQGLRQGIRIELRVGAGAGDRANVDQQVDTCFVQQGCELRSGPRRMAYGVYRSQDRVPPGAERWTVPAGFPISLLPG